MFQTLLGAFGARGSSATLDRAVVAMVEDLEGRQMFSHTPVHILPDAAPVPVLDVPLTAKQATKAAKKIGSTVLPLSITGVTLQGGQLFAQGLLGNKAFSVPLTLGTEANPANPACPILNLELGPIDLDVLGLVVETSEICLRVTAEPGPGNLLGNLLCSVAGLLDSSGPLDPALPIGTVLNGTQPGLDAGAVTNVLNGLGGLLNGALQNILAPTSVVGVTQAAPSALSTDILNLSLGPVDLNLLGLDVELDDCEGGPVTVDISAEAGPGKLLGNLLTGLLGILDTPANAIAIINSIGRITREIRNLLGLLR